MGMASKNAGRLNRQAPVTASAEKSTPRGSRAAALAAAAIQRRVAHSCEDVSPTRSRSSQPLRLIAYLPRAVVGESVLTETAPAMACEVTARPDEMPAVLRSVPYSSADASGLCEAVKC